MAINSKTKPTAKTLDEIPNKIYYSISEASEYTGVEPHVLRYWETKFSKLNPKRVGGNQRKYTRNDIELLFEIVHLLYQEGYTLDGAERKLRMGLHALRAEREEDLFKFNEEDTPLTEELPAEVSREEKQKQLLQEIKQELKAVLEMMK